MAIWPAGYGRQWRPCSLRTSASYTNLEGTSPVVVYVTGYVETPGSFAGVSSDSLLYFLRPERRGRSEAGQLPPHHRQEGRAGSRGDRPL